MFLRSDKAGIIFSARSDNVLVGAVREPPSSPYHNAPIQNNVSQCANPKQEGGSRTAPTTDATECGDNSRTAPTENVDELITNYKKERTPTYICRCPCCAFCEKPFLRPMLIAAGPRRFAGPYLPTATRLLPPEPGSEIWSGSRFPLRNRYL